MFCRTVIMPNDQHECTRNSAKLMTLWPPFCSDKVAAGN